jgi:hypothetical protein
MRDLTSIFGLDKIDEVKKVYNTVVITMINEKEPRLLPFPNENVATQYCKVFVKDWLKMPETTYKILDEYNIVLYASNTPAILVTREYNMLASNLENAANKLESNSKNWF